MQIIQPPWASVSSFLEGGLVLADLHDSSLLFCLVLHSAQSLTCLSKSLGSTLGKVTLFPWEEAT